MAVSFSQFHQRLKEATDIASQIDLAKILGVNRSAITQAKNRNAVPQKWVLALSRSHGLSPDWLEFGRGPRKLAEAGAPGREAAPTPLFSPAAFQGPVVAVPKVRARLCAGGGSFELEAVPVAHHPFPASWLSRMGRPDSMVFMDVIGNSMEPGIADGDMVLVDQSATAPGPRSVMAVGYEDAIYIKRLELARGGMALLSDNQEYAPITIRGDELDSFRVIGRVVWLCRDCR